MKLSTILNSLFLSGLAFTQKAQVYYSCSVPNTIAFTIDDGPTEKIPELLNALDEAGIVATFYVNCNNLMKDTNGQPTALVKPYLQEIFKRGHEIGSHTYNHACLTPTCQLNNPGMLLMDTKETFTEQIKLNEDFIYNAIGVYPATYRAPFGEGQNPGAVNETMLEWLYELGYPYAIHWDIETQDMEYSFSNGDDFALQKAIEHYSSEVGQKDTLITLQHAIPVTIEKIIPWVRDVWKPAHPNMKFVKVSECLGLTDKDIYKTSPGPKTDSNTPSGNVSGKVNSSNNNSGANSIFSGLLITTILVLFNILLNNY
ncbi:glycoside hydrolase/deacetylase [Anaeromyces robustus]|uniref:Glycoside hydrolase/deacetylase n=1 Tax=Anaeromyces robustus TaxID=1754192 RepID=A0A1Y1X362_9FUNG|nr:glycoside hydrolase/deacetylase [Anaeromyces robustus]|eukprot:ORX80213.1 glycoside hydrolase/deacetylase [Anaeromyces robustus]